MMLRGKVAQNAFKRYQDGLRNVASISSIERKTDELSSNLLFSHNHSKSIKHDGRAISPEPHSGIFNDVITSTQQMKINFRNFLEREIDE
jgi:hypothetical protein